MVRKAGSKKQERGGVGRIDRRTYEKMRRKARRNASRGVPQGGNEAERQKETRPTKDEVDKEDMLKKIEDTPDKLRREARRNARRGVPQGRKRRKETRATRDGGDNEVVVSIVGAEDTPSAALIS